MGFVQFNRPISKTRASPWRCGNVTGLGLVALIEAFTHVFAIVATYYLHYPYIPHAFGSYWAHSL